jgi:hypothetical protein
MRFLLSCAVILFAGCATQPMQSSFDRSDMIGFKSDCGQARSQVDYLQARIDAYHAYFKSNPITLEDRRYYTRLKNNIWSLRASCSALQR